MAKIKTESEETNQTHVNIALSDIYVDPKWNARSDLGQAEGGPGDDEGNTGLKGLKLSIMNKGQDTPVLVRPRYDHEKFRQPFFLIAGFRRVTVIADIAADAKDPKPTVKAFIRKLNETEARELNLRENTARENLSGPDLAFGIAAMAEASEKNGMPFTQSGIALALNLSQTYVGKMLAVSKIKGTYSDGNGAEIPILDHWRQTLDNKVTVEKMYRVARLQDTAEQSKLYTSFVRGPSGSDGRNAEGKLQQQIKHAAKWGKTLGMLAHEEAIQLYDEDVFFSVYLERFMNLPEDMKSNDKRKVITAAEEAFQHAAEYGDTKGETEGEETRPQPSPKASSKASAAASEKPEQGKGKKKSSSKGRNATAN